MERTLEVNASCLWNECPTLSYVHFRT